VVQRRRRIGQDVAGDQAHLLHRLAHRGLRQPGAAAVGHGQDADARQVLDRLADRRAPDAIEVHQFAFGRQRVAGTQPALLDQVEQPVHHVLVQLAAKDGRLPIAGNRPCDHHTSLSAPRHRASRRVM
jgi:hypothetical protein